MSNPLPITIKESISELKAILRGQIPLIAKRINMLIVIKQHESKGGISKRELSDKTGANHNSITKWRKLYITGGIDAILSHGRIGFKPRVLSEKEHKAIEKKLKDPKNNLQGYTELLKWIKDEFGKDVKYTTLNEYCKKHFGTKIKVARKSHISKNEEMTNTFKKTLVMK